MSQVQQSRLHFRILAIGLPALLLIAAVGQGMQAANIVGSSTDTVSWLPSPSAVESVWGSGNSIDYRTQVLKRAQWRGQALVWTNYRPSSVTELVVTRQFRNWNEPLTTFVEAGWAEFEPSQWIEVTAPSGQSQAFPSVVLKHAGRFTLLSFAAVTADGMVLTERPPGGDKCFMVQASSTYFREPDIQVREAQAVEFAALLQAIKKDYTDQRIERN